MYKERNLLLSEKEKRRRFQRPSTKMDEWRYFNVKRSMAGIKVVLAERRKIEDLIEKAKTEIQVERKIYRTQIKKKTHAKSSGNFIRNVMKRAKIHMSRK